MSRLSYADNTESFMCRMVHILSMLLLPFMAAFGNVVLTKDANLPRPSDKLIDIFIRKTNPELVDKFELEHLKD